jgi:GMP synthase-like glutamine amidotransferase
MSKFAVIDNYADRMPEKRRAGFLQALSDWIEGRDYEFVRFEQIHDKRRDLHDCAGLILSGSALDLAGPDNRFVRDVYVRMIQEFELLLAFPRPVLGICFGHQLMAIAEEFDSGRTEFGELKIAMMTEREEHRIREVALQTPASFLPAGRLWAQFNHRQEAAPGPALRHYFDIVAASPECPVDVMQHKSRSWTGVQFHPEVGASSKTGDLKMHAAATADGHNLIRQFVQYSLR